MLKRLYVDNYLCLVNFELKLNRMNLLLGGNGAGKSTVFQLLSKIKAHISGEGMTQRLFPHNCLTRWQNAPTQEFQLEMSVGNDHFLYRLVLEHCLESNQHKNKIEHESVEHDGKCIYLFEEGTVHLFSDDYSKGPSFPFDWARSGLTTIMPREDNTKLTAFKKAVDQWLIIKIRPDLMSDASQEESVQLKPSLANFTSWLRFIMTNRQDEYFELITDLKEVIPEFNNFRFDGSDTKNLKVLYGPNKQAYRFNELSDGQRCQIALEILLRIGGHALLAIDEPDNFLALSELQPWLRELRDRCDESPLQALIISHHPEYINYLAADCGIWFERNVTQATRVRPFSTDGDDLSLSELVSQTAM